jgi:hypothetical protein
MYNIHNHYENIWSYLCTIITDPRAIYLIPHGSTSPENIERLAQERKGWWPYPGPPDKCGPMFIFYDQEPIYGDFNYQLFDHIQDNFKGPFILVSTEKNSQPLEHISKRYDWPTVYYFHHAFVAHDWFRGSRYDYRLIPPNQRQLTKKYISFNRLTSGRRVYRSLLIAELSRNNILNQGYVSYNENCPEDNSLSYHDSLHNAASSGLITNQRAKSAIAIIDQINLPLRIDYQDQEIIPNHSFSLSAVKESQQSFCYLVTETCFWERKHHLTEKIFKPIISRMPFVLAGPAHNLKYLKSYGFKTFDAWFDESYDDIDDPYDRLLSITDTMTQICDRSLEQLQDMLVEMQPVLDHNYQLFNSTEFLDSCWQELIENIQSAMINIT